MEFQRNCTGKFMAELHRDTAELAALLRLSVKHVRQRSAAGDWPCYRHHGRGGVHSYFCPHDEARISLSMVSLGGDVPPLDAVLGIGVEGEGDNA